MSSGQAGIRSSPTSEGVRARDLQSVPGMELSAAVQVEMNTSSVRVTVRNGGRDKGGTVTPINISRGEAGLGRSWVEKPEILSRTWSGLWFQNRNL